MNTAELHDFLRGRRSIRQFKPEPVSDAVIRRMLETATYAPSAHHRQPWRFVVVAGPRFRQQLAEDMGSDFRRDLTADGLPAEEIEKTVSRSRQRILTAPALIVLCMDTADMDAYPDARRQAAERAMAVQSTALAGLQLLLAAHAEGLGGVWVCAPLFAPQTVRNSLGLRADWEPQAMFFIGIPLERRAPRQRLAVDQIAEWRGATSA